MIWLYRFIGSIRTGRPAADEVAVTIPDTSTSSKGPTARRMLPGALRHVRGPTDDFRRSPGSPPDLVFGKFGTYKRIDSLAAAVPATRRAGYADPEADHRRQRRRDTPRPPRGGEPGQGTPSSDGLDFTG